MKDIASNLAMMVIPAIVTWYLAKRKNLAEARLSEIESEVKAAAFYRSLLDDAMNRLDRAIETISLQEQKIRELLTEVEHLTEELRKYKQLNGKQP